MKTILVATDFSKAADNACKYAIAMAKDFNSKIILVHAFQAPVMGSDSALTTMQFDYAIMHDAAANDLKRYHHKISKLAEGIEIVPILRTGAPSQEIIEIAKEKKADLIVTGAKGRSFLETTLIGSNAWRILRSASCMVLAVPHNAKYGKGWKKIVYATDLAKDNIAHAKNLIPLAEKSKAEIIFLNVKINFLNRKENEFDKVMNKIKQQIKYPKITGHSINDLDAVEGIHEFISENKADCLCMLTRKRTFIEKLIEGGSETRRMVYYSSIPLLTLHEKDYISRTELKSRKILTINKEPKRRKSSPSELTFNPSH